MSEPSTEAPPAPALPSFWHLWRHLKGAPNRPYLVGSILLALFVAVVVLQTYQLAPVPPGFDSADWTQRSYGFVGLAHPPAQAVGSPYVYPPFIFPFLGLLVRLTQSPLYPGFIFAILMLLGFGATTIHLSRRFLVSGPAQLAFVAAALLNGTTLSMLYWGGYPNFMAFILFNEALVCLLGFLHTRRPGYAVAMWGFVALTYLDHTLTFVLLVASLSLGFLLVAASHRGVWPLVWNRGNLVGLAVLAATVGAYTEVTSLLSISHASYLYSNPAAYQLNNIGQIFTPLSSEPAFFPSGPALFLSVDESVGVLISAALVVLGALALTRRFLPRALTPPVLLASAWLVTCLVVPVAGWYAHVDTVYSRFLYFLPIPLALAAALLVDSWIELRRAATSSRLAAGAEAPVEGSTPSGLPRRVVRLGWRVDAGLLLVVVLLVGTVTVPTASHLEKVDTGLTHDQYFLQAMHALNGNPQPGSVLAAASVVRWTEALTTRGAYEVGPTWLLFFPWQIVNAQRTYFALNGEAAITNNQAAFSYSGLGDPGAVQSVPAYSVLYQGINFPVLRVLPSTINVTTINGSTTATHGVVTPGLSALQYPSAGGGAQLLFTSPGVAVTESTALGSGGSGWLNFTANPSPGVDLSALSFSLEGFPLTSQLLNPSPVASAAVSGNSLYWNLSAGVGPLPDPVPINTVARMDPAPATSAINLTVASPTASLRFVDPVAGAPFTVSIEFQTTPTSNPAVRLPSVLNTTGYLAGYNIHFVMLPNRADYLPTAHQFTQAFGYRTFFVNSEWTILQG